MSKCEICVPLQLKRHGKPPHPNLPLFERLMKDARSPASSYLPWYVLNSTSQRKMILLQTVMIMMLRQCLLEEISNKHVGVLLGWCLRSQLHQGWCFLPKIYNFTSHHKQSRCQRHLTLSTCRRQWFWLTKVVLPLSSQQHVVTTPPFLQAVIKWTTSKVPRRQF